MDLRRFISRLRQERGFTLIEMMIVVTILGFLATVSATLVTVLFTANIRSSQIGEQQTTIENTFGFLSSRIALVKYGDLGVGDGGTGVDPLSLAGDQVLFTSSYDGSEEVCFRLSYIAALGEFRVASGGGSCASSGNANLLPKRGPNEWIWEGGEAYVMPGQGTSGRPFDPVIDSAFPAVQEACESPDGSEAADCQKLTDVRAWVLAAGIENYNPGDPPGSDWNRAPEIVRSELVGASPDMLGSDKFLPPFSFDDRGGTPLAWNGTGPQDPFRPSAVAGINSVSYPLASMIERDVGIMNVRALVSPAVALSGGERTVSARFYEQKYALEQLCLIDPQVGEQAGGDLSGNYPNPQIANEAIFYGNFSGSRSDPSFPYQIKNEFFQGPNPTLPGTSAYTDLVVYNPSDATSAENDGQDVPRGRWMVRGSVTGSSLFGEGAGTPSQAVELSLAHKIGSASPVIVGSSSGNSWPLNVSGVIENYDPAADTVFLRARSRQSGVVVPAEEPDRPVRLELYWMGPVSTP